jgi:hypothetical protein
MTVRLPSARSACAILLVLFLFLPSTSLSQPGRGTISGLVTDASGAVVPGATVEIRNLETGIVQTTTTSSGGLYVLTALVPGKYRVSVALQGFQTVVVPSVTVEVDHTTTVNAELRPGQVTESVEVVAEAAMATTAGSTIGQLITGKTIQDIPVNSRDVYLMVQLAPGVIPVNGAVNQTGAYNRPGVEVSAFKINGQRSGTVAYMLDGSPLTVDGYGAAVTSPAFAPPMESIQESRIETNNVAASYASPGTGVISLVSKSGTDRFHGSGFFFARPNALASNDPFVKASQLRRGVANRPPDFHRYQWGASLGGPIRRGGLFFFGDYEGTQARSLETLTTTVPTEAERKGDLSGIPTIWNPFDVSGTGARLPFPGNIIPARMLNPVSLYMQNLIPLPNQPGAGKYHQDNYFDASLFPNDAKKFDIRLDNYLSSKHQVYGRYSFAEMETGNADHYHNGADPQYYFSTTRGQNILLADNYTINSGALLQVRYSFTRHAEHQPVPDAAKNFDMVKAGFPAWLAARALVHDIPNIGISGMRGVGSRNWSTGFVFISMNHDMIMALDKVRGRHNLKAGFEYKKSFVNMGQPIAASGYYVFDTTATSSKTLAGDGFGYASFMLGMGALNQPNNNFTLDAFIAHASPYYGAYFQDNVRLTPKLTLDVGLRWEIFGGRTERYDRQETFDPLAQFTVNGVSLTGGLVFPKNNTTPFKTNWRDLGPRLGIAYRLGSRGVLHGGAGVFFGPSAHSVAIASTNSDSFSSATTWKATTMDKYGNTVMLNPLNNPFPDGLTEPTQGSLGLATNLGSSVTTMWRSQPTPSAYNWNVGVQRELPGGYLVSAAYVGSRGLHQISNFPANQLTLDQIARYNTHLADTVPNPLLKAITDPASPINGRATVPLWLTVQDFPQFTTGSPSAGVTISAAPTEDTIYHSLQAKLEKRLTTHFSTLAQFTFAKLLSTGTVAYSYIGQNAGHQNAKNGYLDRSVDPQDVSRWFSWAAIYDLPLGSGRAVSFSNRFLNGLLGRWTISSVLYLGSGVPILVSGTWPNKSIYFSQRPNLTCDPAQGAPHTANQWFLPTCYAAPASPYVAGNAPRTLSTVRADGAGNLDFSIYKSFALGEGMRLQFRAEAFNLTNSVQLGIPNASWNPIDTSTFGRVTAAASTPRELQFSARLTF